MKPLSAIIYRGPSLIDGAPIVAVAIASSRNTKTGNMVQTYILLSGIDPRAANKSGADYSICGTCPHRGTPTDDPKRALAKGRSCYVQIGQGPLGVFRMLARDGYRAVTGHADIAAIGSGRMVRLGTYGDPAAVPSYVWDSLIFEATGHTAYSHQSGVQSADFRPDLFMVSADSDKAARAAWKEGRRTFRVIGDIADIIKGEEVLCPASEEAGRRTTCTDCRLCGGAAVKAKSVAIVAHGAGRRYA